MEIRENPKGSEGPEINITLDYEETADLKQQFLDLIREEIDDIVINTFSVEENPQAALQEITKEVIIQ